MHTYTNIHTIGVSELPRQDNCFDFLRYFFALLVIVSHFCTLTDQEQFWFMSGGFRVKAFFTITGFLVSYSFLGGGANVKPYIIRRAIRIIPAYVTCVIFCLFIGWMITSLDRFDFLFSSQTVKYTVSNLFMLNWIEPELPDTFQGQMRPQMNGSLWSMKYEVLFYLALPILIKIMKKVGKIPVLFPILASILILYRVMPIQMQYCTYFFSGMAILLFYDTFYKYSNRLLCIATPFYVVTFLDIPYLSAICQSLEPVTFGIILICIAYKFTALNFFRRFDNVSYGLYLYHFPVIQCLIHCGLISYNIKLGFVFTIFFTVALACLSWFCIEKPFKLHCRLNK